MPSQIKPEVEIRYQILARGYEYFEYRHKKYRGIIVTYAVAGVEFAADLDGGIGERHPFHYIVDFPATLYSGLSTKITPPRMTIRGGR